MDGGRIEDLYCKHRQFAATCLCCKVERVMREIKADPWIRVYDIAKKDLSYGGK